MKSILLGGFHKTATSAVQMMLEAEALDLEKEGVHYVQHRQFRKRVTNPLQKLAVIQDKKEFKKTRKLIVNDIKDFFAVEAQSEPSHLILSDENITGHCGQIVRKQRLYPKLGVFLYHFENNIKVEIDEVHLTIRSYDAFFSSCYQEYLRSFKQTASNLVRPETFAEGIFDFKEGWPSLVARVVKKFPNAKFHIWTYEDIAGDFPALINGYLENTSFTQAPNLVAPKRKRPGMSAEAVNEILRTADEEGIATAFEKRRAIQEKLVNQTPFALWTPEQAAHLRNRYQVDLALLKNTTNLRMRQVSQIPI